MSNFLGSEILAASRNLCYSPIKKNRKHILKSRENIFKPKCNKELKKKLKKYKLRRDGIEDPDVLDVSQILVTSLRIKSPNNKEKIYYNNNTIESEDLNPANYLIKMVRRKKTCLDIGSLTCVKSSEIINNCPNPLKVSDKEEHKQQMDAFKLMMDSRNKSIGSNSPGKEKTDEPESKEHLDKKENRAKRILSLQKMALSKGAVKNKEIEEYRESCINKKMLKRAEKFKDMLIKPDGKNNKKNVENPGLQLLPVDDISNQKCSPVNLKSLKLYNILDETKLLNYTKPSKKIQEEDSEFLKKLAPSLKKTENMLCYFQKISKDDNNLFEQSENSNELENNEPVIKEKLQPKHRNKTKKKQSLEKLNEKPLELDNDSIMTTGNSNERCKRKRNLKIEKSFQSKETSNFINTDKIQNRPKRHSKKPVKYTEDVHIFSSDEELHIFTPKKKKISEKYSEKVNVIASIQIDESNHMGKHPTDIPKVKVRNVNLKITKKDQSKKMKSDKTKLSNHTKCVETSRELSKKKVKLAPIFATKTQLSSADIEAKQKFLNSGVPEKLKRKPQQTSHYVCFDIFPPGVHIRQSNLDVTSQGKDWFKIPNNVDIFSDTKLNQYSFKSLLILDGIDSLNIPVTKQKSEKVLKNIKSVYPKFPVYRTYHLLKGKSQGEFKECNYPNLDNSIEIINNCMDFDNENPDKLSWCDKYKPTSSKHIIGNFESVKELKRWLETWTENLVKPKYTASDSSDFSDFYHSDMDSRDTSKNTNNVLILTGRTGSGKTSSVYAVASELAIKVIEVNASSKRTGKRVLQDLQEATQSHKVDRGKSGSEGSQKLEDVLINRKKRVKSKKIHKLKQDTKIKAQLSHNTGTEVLQTKISASQENVRTGMSLILIDDADIIFEQDDGFCSAISQLIQTSKRPVILSTSSLTCIHLQRFLQSGKILHMHPLLPRMLGTWLDIMCLADVGVCHSGLGAKLLDFYKGDMRKTINYLHFYMNSNKNINQLEEVAPSQVKCNFDDENSSISWAESENLDIPNDTEGGLNVDKHLQALYSTYPLDMFDIWWSMLSNFTEHNAKTEDYKTSCVSDGDIGIDRIAEILDTMSIVDFYDRKIATNIVTKPWHGYETASLLDNENFDYYRKTCFVSEEISEVLMKSSIVGVENTLKNKSKLRICTPSMDIKRSRDKVVSRHITLSTYLSLSAVLDRHAIALDYWSSCRAICRIEKNRNDSNVKRKNRFCHYLKSLSILCKNDYFDSLANSLS